MLKLLLQFCIGIAVGIYGYLVPGYINLSVLQLGLQNNRKQLAKVLLILSLIEIPYCFLCMSGIDWLVSHHEILFIIKWLLVIFLLVFAFITLLDAKKSPVQSHAKSSPLDQKQIRRLIWVAIFNPFQLSAWTIWGIYFIEKTWFSWTSFSIFIFSVAAALGVFIILAFYAFAGSKIVQYFSLKRKQIDYAVACILLFLAVLQIYRNIFL
ncbi:MAG: LysE family transporter [Bacteroidetes bacterium]|nr:LysE family transporter [Bacteroidota bacterium]